MFLSNESVSLTEKSYVLHCESFTKGKGYPEHSHEFYEYFLVLSGTLLHTVNGEQELLPAGTLKFIRPEDCHALACGPDCREAMIYNCNIATAELKRLLMFLTSGRGCEFDDFVRTVRNVPETEWNSLRDRLKQLLRMKDAPDRKEHSSVLFRLAAQDALYLLFRHSFNEPLSFPVWLEKAFSAMHKRENFIAGLPRFLELSGKSGEHLCRSMKKYCGITPEEFILALRLEEAARRLGMEKTDISRIAYECGFHNFSYFRRSFQQRFDSTPRKYRQGIAQTRTSL